MILVCFILGRALQHFFRTRYHTCFQLYYQTFMGVLQHFHCGIIFSSLPDMLLYALSYIFSEMITYLYHFQTRYPGLSVSS